MVRLLAHSDFPIPYLFTAPLNLKLAQRHYQVRMHELRDLLLAEEIKFKCASYSDCFRNSVSYFCSGGSFQRLMTSARDDGTARSQRKSKELIRSFPWANNIGLTDKTR